MWSAISESPTTMRAVSPNNPMGAVSSTNKPPAKTNWVIVGRSNSHETTAENSGRPPAAFAQHAMVSTRA